MPTILVDAAAQNNSTEPKHQNETKPMILGKNNLKLQQPVAPESDSNSFFSVFLTSLMKF